MKELFELIEKWEAEAKSWDEYDYGSMMNSSNNCYAKTYRKCATELRAKLISGQVEQLKIEIGKL